MATQARGETSLKIVLIIGLTLLNGATVGLLGWLFWQDGVLAGMVGIGLVAIQCGVQQFLHCREHISDRQRIEETEAALRLSEQQLKVALQASKLGSWQLDLKTNEFSSSEQCKTNFGLSPDSDLSYGQLIEQIHPDDRANVQESLQRAIEQHTDYEAEHRIILADGAIRWILSRGAAIYEPDVSPSQLFGVSLDITDRKHVEAELRQSQRFTEQVTNDSPQLLYIFDLTTQRNVYVNRQIATILGYTLEQLEQEGAQFLQIDYILMNS
ncbi:MAG: PAS domain-containing protein [Cyanobacteria bacterium CRU_2_1]|nr:PAS domain-containing protein [Cyanobacteria bacterium CRU_2_1]